MRVPHLSPWQRLPGAGVKWEWQGAQGRWEEGRGGSTSRRCPRASVISSPQPPGLLPGYTVKAARRRPLPRRRHALQNLLHSTLAYLLSSLCFFFSLISFADFLTSMQDKRKRKNEFGIMTFLKKERCSTNCAFKPF